MEIRAGAGGDEASLFAGDLFRMYTKFFDAQGWKHEIMDVTEGTAGGFKEIVVKVEGLEIFGTLKFEAGVHRVQRVPDTETQGRVHTSAATVAVFTRSGRSGCTNQPSRYCHANLSIRRCWRTECQQK